MYLNNIYKTIDKKLLVVKGVEYQRPELKAHVSKIVKEFNPELFGTILVCDLGNNTYEVIDGQQRTLAALQIEDISHIPAQVLSTRPVQERSKIYRGFNEGRKNLRPIDMHKSKLVSETPPSDDIEKMLNRLSDKNSGTGAIGVLYDLYESDSDLLENIWYHFILKFQDVQVSTNVLRGLFRIESRLLDQRSLFDMDIKTAILISGQSSLHHAATEYAGLVGTNSAPNWSKGIVLYLNKHYNLRIEMI